MIDFPGPEVPPSEGVKPMLKIDPDAIRAKRHFDEKEIPDDVWLVLEASSLLGVGEFRLFEIAYEQWFGEKGEEKTVEKWFVPYMFANKVPTWVVMFARRVVALEKEGKLNPREFGIFPRFASREDIRKGLDFAAWLVLWMTGIILLGRMAAEWLDMGCMFPPCY